MVTFAPSGDDAFELNSAVAGAVKDSQVRGSQMVLRSAMGYGAASRASAGGEKAFESATKFLVGNMLRSVTKKLEIVMLYGQSGLATLDAGSTTTVLKITNASWAPGIWAGAEGMPITLASSVDVPIENSTITSVDLSAKTLTVATLGGAPAAGVKIFFKDAVVAGPTYNEMAGLHKILTNTGSLFNISASSYSLWKGNTYSAGAAALSFAKLQDAIALGVGKGLDSDVSVLVNPDTWADLISDQAAARELDSSYSPAKSENGSKSILFHGQNGMMEIIPSIYVKAGEAFVIDKKCFQRIGSTDVTFDRPGKPGEFFRELEDHAGFELRCYTDQALFCHAPGRNIYISGIVNS